MLTVQAAGSEPENGKAGPAGRSLAAGTPDPASPKPKKKKANGGASFASKAKAAAAQQQAAQQARDADHAGRSKPGGAAKQKAGGSAAQRGTPAAGAASGGTPSAAAGAQEPRSGKKATPARPKKGAGAELGPEGQLLQDASGHTIYPAADALVTPCTRPAPALRSCHATPTNAHAAVKELLSLCLLGLLGYLSCSRGACCEMRNGTGSGHLWSSIDSDCSVADCGSADQGMQPAAQRRCQRRVPWSQKASGMATVTAATWCRVGG